MATIGRPRIEFDENGWRQIEGMAEIHCTGEEIAGVMGCSYDTLEKRIRERYDLPFTEWYKIASADGKKCLRRCQFDAAKKGNSALLIWLGKQYLGQKDNNAQDLFGSLDISLKYPEKKDDEC